MEGEQQPHSESRHAQEITESKGPEVKKAGGAKLADYIFWLSFVAIILVFVYYRIPMLRFYGLYEPDGYFHYSLITQAIKNGFSIPQVNPLTGWPKPAVELPHHEPFGLYWMTLIPYFFLQFAGMSAYTIMRLMPVVAGVFGLVGAYFLARHLSRDRFFGLLAMLFIALNMGNAARTSALIYRGDSFVTAFFIAALLLTIAIFKTHEKRKKMYLMLLAGFSLSLCNLVWNGAAFATAIYITVFGMLLSVCFIFEKKEIASDMKYMLGALAFWYLLVAAYKGLNWIVSVEAFTGLNFFLLLVPMAVGWYSLDQVVHKRQTPFQFADNKTKRAVVALAAIAAVIMAIYAIIPSFVDEIFVTSGFLATESFSSTIQELQAPSLNFLMASFGLQNFANPMSLIMLAATQVSGLQILFWIGVVLALMPYFFMHVEKDGDGAGFMSGHARLHFGFDVSLIMLIAYFALTAYLQMFAIRFNSLISIPLSIFSAYTIYWLMLASKRFVIFGQRLVYMTSFVLLLLMLIYIIQTNMGYISALAPADQINPQFIQALAWLRNNSASNSVVLTLWPDGSPVEAVANRISVTDSVGSQYKSRAQPFAAWLYNSSPDPSFLLSNFSGKPDYLLVRSTWMYETGGIFTESEINVTPSTYGYNIFTGLQEQVNSTTQLYRFTSASGLTEETILTTRNGTRTVTSYLKLQNGTNVVIQPFAYVGFYDEHTGNFSLIHQTSFNVTNDQTFLIAYSSIPATNLYVNITGAYMFAKALADSNMIKFIFECGRQQCPWNNNVAGLGLVYVNPDTKIFKIFYNQSNPRVQAAEAEYPRVAASAPG